jgi:hypothetical protein
MNFRLKRARLALAAGAAALAAVAGIGLTVGTASADTKFFTAWASGTCDTTAGEWMVIWHITNRSEEAATIADVETVPADTKADLPAEVGPRSTVYGYQRVPASGGAQIKFNAKWADGTTNPNFWVFSPVTTCTKA